MTAPQGERAGFRGDDTQKQGGLMTFRENYMFKAGVRERLASERFIKERREDELARLSAPTVFVEAAPPPGTTEVTNVVVGDLVAFEGGWHRVLSYEPKPEAIVLELEGRNWTIPLGDTVRVKT